MKKGNYFKMAAVDQERAEIFIYGDIVPEGWRWSDDETSAVSFRDALKSLGDVSAIDLRINSGGGDVFEAVAIYNMIKRHPATVTAHVDGLAASAASVIAMAADKLMMPANSMLMIHNAWSVFMGDHNAFRKFADDLENINQSVKRSYLDKNSELKEDELSALMDAETWLSAQEALEMGLADEVITAVQVAASITEDQMARYSKTPAALTEDVKEPSKDVWDMEKLAKAVQDMQASIHTIQQQNKEPEKEPLQSPENSGLRKLFLQF